MKRFTSRHSLAARHIRYVSALITAAALLATFAVAWATVPATAAQPSHGSQVPEEVAQLMQDNLPKAAQFIATQGTVRTGDVAGRTAHVRYIQPYYVIAAGDDGGYQAVDVGWIAAITIRGKPAGTASVMRDPDNGTITPYETTTNADVAACLERAYREGGVFAELTRLHPYGYFMIKDGKVTPLNEESEHYITEAVSEDEFFDGLNRLSAWLDEASQLGSSAPDISSNRNVLVNPLEPLDTGTPVDAILISAAFTLLLVGACGVGLYRGIARLSRRSRRHVRRVANG
ncbi:hypothetical protein [Bifidobacterium biavatii]|uniref:Uncharacterized protein n=1 Tax=Bifidobacterium biavatii DSM 23969 TaxID=1437608 RepID=A0A087A1M2_9BIFI|nr:hypothetical protein [Bifidobacterium biavatii]KFI52672.1 hypothetical protein BBIA_0353 [Bifidobacterium biavatii DSM 23969]